MDTSAPAHTTANTSGPASSLLSFEERTFADLVVATGPVCADRYFTLVVEYGLPISLVRQCRNGFSKCSTNYLSGDPQAEREVATLRALIPLLGKAQDRWLADRFELPSSVVRSLRLHKGITTFDYSGQVPPGELGLSTDKDLAARYGVPAYVVTSARQAMGIGEAHSVKARGLKPADVRAEDGNGRWQTHLVRAQSMPELIERLGTAPDTELADQFGVNATTVGELRTRHGIRKFSSRDKLARDNPDLVSRLGTATDIELSTQFGIPGYLIALLRRHLGIKRFSPYDQLAREKPDLVARLGVDSDTELATAFGLSYETVNQFRRYLGIDKYSKDGGARNVPPEHIEMFKSISLGEMAKLTGKTTKALRKIRKALGIPHFKPASVFTPEVISALGTAPDPDIADRFGIDRSHLTKHRIKLGIKPYSGVGRPMDPVSAELTPLLGKIPDTKLAKQFGISAETVRRKRYAGGIPTCTPRPGTAMKQADRGQE